METSKHKQLSIAIILFNHALHKLHQCRRIGPGQVIYTFTVFEQEKGRYRANSKILREIWDLVSIKSDEGNFVLDRIRVGVLFEEGADRYAGTAP